MICPACRSRIAGHSRRRGLLDRMRAVVRQGLDGGDEAAFEIGEPDPAAPHRPAVDMDGAGAAMAGAAAKFGAGEVGRVAKTPRAGASPAERPT